MSAPGDLGSIGSSVAGAEGSVPDPASVIPEISQTTEQPAATTATVVDDRFWTGEDFLQEMPTMHHTTIKKYIDKVNADYNDRVSKYSPYEDFISRKPEEIAAGVTFFDKLETEEGAREIYEALGNILGVTPKQAEQIVEQQQEMQLDPGNDPEEEDPRDAKIRELEERIGRHDETFNRQVQIEKETQYRGELDTAVEAAVKAEPWLGNEVAMGELMERVFALENKTQGRLPMGTLISQSVQQMKAYNQYVHDTMVSRQQSATGNQPPRVMGPTASNPGSAVDVTKMDESERKAYLAEKLRGLGS